MKKGFIILLLLLPFLSRSQTQRFVSPIEGSYGHDWKIINYVDWAADTFFKDNHCLSKSYDGHQGTDFCIRNFRKMDSGVNVYAADAGRVIFVRDGLFDRNKVSVVSRGLGNYVGIRQSGKLFTYYGHLRKNSIVVQVGDSVSAGQKLGQVGSSGNSSDPHLHFELWYDSSYYIDPFTGPCGNSHSYWLNEPSFDSSFGVWTSGMCPYSTSLDTLREEPLRRDSFYLWDPAISYWAELTGIRKEDSISIEWYTPSHTLWGSFGRRENRDWWLYYFWSELSPSVSMPEGTWQVRLIRNGNLVLQRSFFYFQSQAAIAQSEIHKWAAVHNGRQLCLKGLEPGDQWYLQDVWGKLLYQGIAEGSPVQCIESLLSNGIYFIQVRSRSGARSVEKIYW
ncbi:MAG: M23 family metallopeptidase [Bacteroidetes bacterium]|nr:M23 family metallopeptidase [Bacteroidota bacterium]